MENVKVSGLAFQYRSGPKEVFVFHLSTIKHCIMN